MTNEQRATAIIAACRARGSDAEDLRDAAHEAHHALEAGATRWGRESIHRALMRLGRVEGVTSEIMARAVEQIVCADLGVKTHSVESCAFTTFMESTTYGTPMLPGEDILPAILRAMKLPPARAAADAVLALADAPAPKKRRTRKAAPEDCRDAESVRETE